MTSKVAIVVGSADCVWRDLKEAQRLFPDADIIAVNHAGVDLDTPLTAWVSLHGWELLRVWMPLREAKGYPAAEKTFSGLDAGDQKVVKDALTACVEAKFEGQNHSGASGLFGVKVAAVDLGYETVVCCGIPMWETPHYHKSHDDHPIDGKPNGWVAATSYWVGWQEALPKMKGIVFSMGGYTREILGAPEGAKLESEMDAEPIKAPGKPDPGLAGKAVAQQVAEQPQSKRLNK